MKRSYRNLIIFDCVIVLILLLNSFILNILSNYYYMSIFLVLLLIAFKFIFGFEKDNYRYSKEIVTNMVILLLISFIFYYILGIFTGFYRTENYLNFYGIKTFIFPYIMMVILREYFRVQILNKARKSKLLIFITFILFVFLELLLRLNRFDASSAYNIFIFIALTVLPILSVNIACTYIALKVGPKPNIFWILVVELYTLFLPIAPSVGLFIRSLVDFLFPFVLMYDVYSFFKKREKNVPISYVKRRVYVEMYSLAILVFVLAYFVSGFFRYYVVAVATGSMLPNIKVGDVVVVDQHKDYKDLKIGDVIAYKYNGIVVVHRICEIIVVKEDYYFYTKGDNNDAKDNYTIYPETILGSVNSKIPYIGLPTVWFNKVFN